MLGATGPEVNRSSVVASIYGYLVCLIAVLLFVGNSAGFINNAFRIASPGLSEMHGPHMFVRSFGPRGGFGPGLPPEPGIEVGQVPVPAGVSPSPGPSGKPETQRLDIVRSEILGEGRLNAVRGLVVNIVLLIISVLLFRAHWTWLGSASKTS